MSAARLLAVLLAALLGAAGPAWAVRGPRLDTTYDEADAGRSGAAGVARTIGLIDDEQLTGYVQSLGDRLLRGVPGRASAYTFRVVDQVEPNAFALPGGYVFVSRELLALVNSEAELACVLGHEIAHVLKRHAAARQGVERTGSPFVHPLLRAGRVAAYSRELETTADRDGQKLCAAAGYDPRSLGTFLESLVRYEQARTGQRREASYFDSHPLSSERASIAFIHASELRWKRDPARGDPRAALLDRLDGLPVGQRPESGVFLGSLFLHVDLDFKLRFPSGWQTQNSAQAVAAQAPKGDAVVYLMADVPNGSPERVARAWAVQNAPAPARVEASAPLTVGGVKGWKLDIRAPGAAGRSVIAHVGFVPHGGALWRLTGAGLEGPSLPRTLATLRSFSSLDDEDRAAVRSTRLRLVKAEAGEDLAGLVKRAQSTWSAQETALYNGERDTSRRYQAGETVKVAREEPYAGPAASGR